MRKKIIRAFLGVYLAICVTYGVVRGVTVPAAVEDIEPLEEALPQTTAEIVSAPEPEIILEPEPSPDPTPAPAAIEETTYNGRGRGKHGSRGGTSAEPSAIAEETPAPTPTPEAESEPEEEPEPDDEGDEDDASEPAAIPTLEEYLKNLHCGGCGRNCFLLNPHCMRGARKESRAESAYYEQYGESYGAGGEL